MYKHDDMYMSLTKDFCDGFGVELGAVSKQTVRQNLATLTNSIQRDVEGILVKHIMPQQRGNESSLWITLSPETAPINSYTMSRLVQVVNVTRLHARRFWLGSEGDDKAINLVKVDVARDFKGSFIPGPYRVAYNDIKRVIESELPALLADSQTNFLSLDKDSELSVKPGDNDLDTCYHFDAIDKDGDRLVTIKMYDKVIDLVAREGIHIVGSRTREIVGSKRGLNLFNKSISTAQNDGVTRLEISICKAALAKFKPHAPSSKTLWH